ncbi:unnamed protein product, partial [Cuscuta epithymum]
MAGSKLRKAIGAVKDQTSISLAKVGGSASLSELEIAIVKATRHEEYPPEEKHIREILCLTCYSRAYVGACVSTISRRLSKTKNWVVALKSLMVIHRLLIDGDQSYEQEFFFATRRGTRLLNMSDFRDSRSNSWDFSAFVRTYSLYLDEQLEFRMQTRRGKHGALTYEEDDEEVGPGAIVVRTTPVSEMKNEHLFSRTQHCMQILDRFLACRPAGAAKHNRLVFVAMYQIVRESFQIYYAMAEIFGILVDRFMKLDIPDSRKVYEIFYRVSKQYDELEMFYEWSKSAGIARLSDYPDMENYPKKKLDIMEEIIREKTEMERARKMKSREPSPVKVEDKEPEPEQEQEEDANATKALPPPPPPEDLFEEKKEEEPKEEEKEQEIGDLLNLGGDAPTPEEHANQLALALFDGAPATAPPAATTGITPWEAFTGDWETALVQSTSHLSNQKVQLPGGFDQLMLDGMYHQGVLNQAVTSSGIVATGSASSVAFGSAGKPAMLALPAPPSTDGAANAAPGTDPFTASLSVAPPAYVQMSDIDKKQRLLIEEQQMWQQYARNGMQGQVGLENV